MADLETETIETPPTPAAADPAPPPAQDPPPEPAAEPDPEGTVEVAGQKLLPVGAVIAERRERQRLESQLRDAQQGIAQLQPYIQFLQANPHLFQQHQQTAPAAPAAAEDDPEAVELARTLDLYTPEGKPDATRALKLITAIDRRAEGKAQSAVRPMHETTTRERSGLMFQRALATQAPDGRRADPQLLQQLWQRTDPTVTATEEGAAGVVALALGLSAMTSAPAAPPPPQNPPLITETPGGRPAGRTALTALDQSVIKIRGVKPETYAELTRGFNPGASNVLED